VKELALKTRPEFHSRFLFLVLLLVPFAVFAQTSLKKSQGASILGFSPANAAAEHNLEAIFETLPSPEKSREWHRLFTAEPHPTASEQNNKLAEFLALEWRKQGWEDITLRRYDVLHSSPRSVFLEMVAPIYFKASLREDPYASDPDTKNPAISGSYFGYSTSGDVTAELVYAHSGNPEVDLDRLGDPLP
jgi:N-acetylated-alpha-linked acidic dipeptidase